MKNLSIVVVAVACLAPWSAMAQVAVPQPPVPPSPPAAPVRVAPATPPRPAPPEPFIVIPPIDVDRITAEVARAQADVARVQAKMFELTQPLPVEWAAQASIASQDAADAEYRSGLSLVQERRYDEAIRVLDRVINRKSDRADAALYWRAFAQFKIGQGDTALASIAALRRDHASSRYLADAKVLEAEVRRLAGRPVAPDSADDDEIKLLAIQGLSKSSEAVPLLEGVLAGANSLNVKKRALYVLALSEDARANEILMRYATGGGNPDLQFEAVRYLGARRGGATSPQLREIYESTSDARVKLAVIDAFRSTGDKAMLVSLYGDKRETVAVRKSIVSRLGGLVDADDVLALYRQETDPDLKMQLLAVLGAKLGAAQLAQIARTDTNTSVRVRAVRSLGNQRNETAAAVLLEVYDARPEREVRRAVIDVFAGQGNADALVTLARKETDLELKRDLVRQLSSMASKSKAAADYLMEQLR